MREHLGRPLLFPDDVVFTCQNSGACCRNDWLIGVDTVSLQRLRDVDWQRVDPALPPGEKFTRLPLPLSGGETTTFARKPCGECVFLTSDARCSIHRHLGRRVKPQICQEFPYYFVETPDGIAVGLSFACTAVRGHHGRSLPDQQAEILEVLEGSTRVNQIPDPIVLYSGIDIGWEDYRPIERGLLDVLDQSDRPFAHALIAGSLLVNLCVSLRQVEIAARNGGESPKETLHSGLERLRSERYQRLFEIAAGIRYPRGADVRHPRGADVRHPQKTSQAHLAPLYAWLQLSRQKISRFALVYVLYRDYLRFRRGRGRVPDLVTNGNPLDLTDVARIRFTTDAETTALLRQYWSHVIFRKTLTPMHGVFRGYHMMLALYAFAKWAAKIHAFREGRAETTLADVRDAVRLLEQRFILHSQFGNVFSVSPILTVLADRLFGSPSFVPATALEPP